MTRVPISGLPAASSAGVNDLLASTQADGVTRKITLGQVTNLVPVNLSFLDLNDTPGSYAGQQDKGIKVNSTATGLEFTAGTSPLTTADNGLTENPAGNVQLGGVLTGNTQVGQSGDLHDLDLFGDTATFEGDTKVNVISSAGDAVVQSNVGDVQLLAPNQTVKADASAIDVDAQVGDVAVDAAVGNIVLTTATGQVNTDAAGTSELKSAAQLAMISTGGNVIVQSTVGDVRINPGVDLIANAVGNNIDFNCVADAGYKGGTSAELSSPGTTTVGNPAGSLIIEPGSVPGVGDLLVAQDALGTVDWQAATVITSASNGLNVVGNDVRLGGNLTVTPTDIGQAASGVDFSITADLIGLTGESAIRVNPGAANGFPPKVGDTLVAATATGALSWLRRVQFGQWFLPFNAIADSEFPLVGEISSIATGQVGDFATTTSMRNTHLSIVVNSITSGGDIVVSGDSVDPVTNVVTSADTETVTVDTTAAQIYQTDKKWLQITSVDVTTGAIVGINYDLNRLGYIFDQIEQEIPDTQIRILGWRMQFATNNNQSDLGIQMFVINDSGSKKLTIDTVEDITVTSQVGNGQIIDNLRGGGSDRSYTHTVTAIPSGSVFSYFVGDLNVFFTSGENVISAGSNDGLQVIFTGTGGGLNNIEHGTFTLIFIEEPI